MTASCIRYTAMIVALTLVLLGLVYLNGHAAYSVSSAGAHDITSTLRRFAPYLGAVTAAIMLAFLLGLYRNTRRNAAIFAASAALFSGSLYLVDSHPPVSGEASIIASIAHPSLLARPGAEKASRRDLPMPANAMAGNGDAGKAETASGDVGFAGIGSPAAATSAL